MNADPDVTGYKLYYGPISGNYTQSIDVGNVTTYIVSNLASGNTYYFAATGHDATGNESGYSNEVSTTLPVLYSITATSDSNGTITPLGNPPVSQASSGSTVIKSVTVNQGSSQSFTITPNSGYRVAEVKADGASLGAAASYTFSNVAADHALAATFAVNTYSISSTSGAGGSISPAGTATVNSGASQVYTITPSSGYRVAGVVVDGVSVGAVSSYSFNNVTANHTISATFAVNTFTISATSGTGGSVSPAGTATVNSGASQTYTIIPSSGYRVAGVVVDGVSVGAVSSYSFNNVTANHTISATFAVNTFTISETTGTGGSVSPAGTATVNSGASQTYTIIPSSGYRVADVAVDGVSVGSVASYSFASVNANHTIAALFTINSYTISASAGSGGAISPTGSATLNYGASKIYTITASSGYAIADVKVDGVSVGAVSSYTFGNVTASHSIVAAFAVNSYIVTSGAGSGGSISPAGTMKVDYGGSQSYAIAPQPGYSILNVVVDGVSFGVLSSYTFSNCTANHVINATFAARNLLSNGDFESGNLSGWSNISGIALSGKAAFSGNFGAKMATSGHIDRVFNSTIGKTYYVSARIRIDRQIVTPNWGGLLVNIFDSTWKQNAASQWLTTANSPIGLWTQLKFSFIATTAQSRLRYQNFGLGQFEASADNFVVSEIP